MLTLSEVHGGLQDCRRALRFFQTLAIGRRSVRAVCWVWYIYSIETIALIWGFRHGFVHRVSLIYQVDCRHVLYFKLLFHILFCNLYSAHISDVIQFLIIFI